MNRTADSALRLTFLKEIHKKRIGAVLVGADCRDFAGVCVD